MRSYVDRRELCNPIRCETKKIPWLAHVFLRLHIMKHLLQVLLNLALAGSFPALGNQLDVFLC